MLTLAGEFMEKGHEVKVVTKTPAGGDRTFDFEVFRRPGPLQLFRLARWCDVYFQANLSLRGVWPVLMLKRAFAVTHQGWYGGGGRGKDLKVTLKFLMSRLAVNVSASKAVAAHLQVPSHVIPNPYREDIFYLRPHVRREREVVYLGRLVSDKGVDVLISALSALRERGVAPRVTVVGVGPEEAALRRQASEAGVDGQVDFVGLKTGSALAEVLNAHQILVAPSRVQEGFGIVALEGIACGCVVVGSDAGGLKEAIGPCGLTFPNGDAGALARTLAGLLSCPESLKKFRAGAEEHLARHRKGAVAEAYLSVFEGAALKHV